MEKHHTHQVEALARREIPRVMRAIVEPEETPVPTPGHDTTQRDFPARGNLWSWGED